MNHSKASKAQVRILLSMAIGRLLCDCDHPVPHWWLTLAVRSGSKAIPLNTALALKRKHLIEEAAPGQGGVRKWMLTAAGRSVLRQEYPA